MGILSSITLIMASFQGTITVWTLYRTMQVLLGVGSSRDLGWGSRSFGLLILGGGTVLSALLTFIYYTAHRAMEAM